MIDYCQLQTSQGVVRGTIHNSSLLEKSNVFVLLLHGYLSSNRIGPNRLYYRLANALANVLNIPVVRFDCYGMGESDGDLNKITFSDFIQSYISIINHYLDEHEHLKILLVGHCIGANIATELAILYPSNIIGAVFISPSLTDEDSLNKVFTNEQLCELKASGHTVRKGITVNSSFIFEQNLAENVISRIVSLSCRWYLIVGNRDEFFNYTHIKKRFSSTNIVEIDNADHNYLGQDESSLFIEVCANCLSEILNETKN